MKDNFGIIKEVKNRFPDFVITAEMNDLPTVIFSFLTIDLIEAINNSNCIKLDVFVKLINDMEDYTKDNNDNTVLACMSEFFLGIYDTTDVEYNFFINKLSKAAQNRFDLTIKLWNGYIPPTT